DKLVTGVQTCALPISVDARSGAAAQVLAHYDRQPHLRPELQVLVADVRRCLGALDLQRVRVRLFPRSAGEPAGLAGSVPGRRSQIGRASCREGVEVGG